MQTRFSLAQLADPAIAESESILRKCVHCGFCTATCPTYLLLGDELDSPRGRIYLIKDMLEGSKPAGERVARHIDRCLSCLSCMTTCPSGVDYMHLVDHAREHVEATYRRPVADALLRRMVAFVLPRPGLLRAMLAGAAAARPMARFLPGRLGNLVSMAPKRIPAPSPADLPQVFRAQGRRRLKAVLMSGCAQTVLAPAINEATVRLLVRHGVEVVVARGTGCCGALAHHMGRAGEGRACAAANIRAWIREAPDIVVVNASGCGTMIKDYGHMFRNEPAMADNAARVSAVARDITEVAGELGLRPAGTVPRLRVAYHSACSMQHGQKLTGLPADLLSSVGFEVAGIPEGHICCGSAGTYNILQHGIAGRLRTRKVAHIESVGPDLVATGNIGCMVQIAGGTDLPVVHTVELLDWATGGPRPPALGPGISDQDMFTL